MNTLTREMLARQQGSISLAQKIMSVAGLESVEKFDRDEARNGKRVIGRSSVIKRLSNPILLPLPEYINDGTDDLTLTYARLFERRDEWRDRLPLPRFVGDLALREKPRYIHHGIAVIMFEGDIEKATTGLRKGLESSYVPYPEDLIIDREEQPFLAESLGQFETDVRGLASALDIEQA